MVHKVRNGEVFFERIVDSMKPALLQARKIEGGLAKGFAGNRARVDAASAHVLRALDDCHALAKICCLRPALFASGAAANHNQIKTLGRSHSTSPVEDRI